MYMSKTKNVSFVNVWRQLQNLEIENCSFILEVRDKSLVNFNIEDLKTDDINLKDELMKKIIEECKHNIWFFFREIVRLPSFYGYIAGINDYDTPYILNIETMLMIYMYEHRYEFLFSNNSEISKMYTETLVLLQLYDNFINKSNTGFWIPIKTVLLNANKDFNEIKNKLLFSNYGLFTYNMFEYGFHLQNNLKHSNITNIEKFISTFHGNNGVIIINHTDDLTSLLPILYCRAEFEISIFMATKNKFSLKDNIVTVNYTDTVNSDSSITLLVNKLIANQTFDYHCQIINGSQKHIDSVSIKHIMEGKTKGKIALISY